MSGPRYAREPNLSLAQAAGHFFREGPPKFLVAHLLAWIAYRGYLAYEGDIGAWDLAPLILIPLVQPFVEWLIHVFILHHKPKQAFGRRWDFHAARYHRAHHRDPWDMRFTVMPLPAMVTGLGLGAAMFWLIAPSPGVWATSMVIVGAFALYYEWIHFLTHTSYRPRGWLFKRQRKLHRLHHYKNERYWMGVTRHMGDMVLGTFPDPGEVEKSRTARTLGVEAVD